MKRLDIKDKIDNVLYRVYLIEYHFDNGRRLVNEETGECVNTVHISKDSIKDLICNEYKNYLVTGKNWDIDFLKKIDTIKKKGSTFTVSTLYKDIEGETNVLDTRSFNSVEAFEEDTKKNIYRLTLYGEDIIIERVMNIKGKKSIINKPVEYIKNLLKTIRQCI